MKSKIVFATTLVIGLSMASAAFASEVTGTLTAGSGNAVSGTVIGPPTASPVAGSYNGNQSVTLTSIGASSIRYSISTTTPSCTGDGSLYSAPIVITQSTTLSAVSCYSSGQSSTIGTYVYTISGGTLSGTVATSSAGSLSGTVSSSPGGTLSGTVIAPAAPVTGGSGGGGGGGGNGPPIGLYGTTNNSGSGNNGSSTGTGSGIVLGESTTDPNLPNTGAGGNAPQTILIIALCALIALSGTKYLALRN